VKKAGRVPSRPYPIPPLAVAPAERPDDAAELLYDLLMALIDLPGDCGQEDEEPAAVS